MTEKEKMLNSQMYNAMGDKQLRNERCYVKNLCREYNNLPFEDEDAQKNLFRNRNTAANQKPHSNRKKYCQKSTIPINITQC